ncbi:MAG: hypothetical protein U5R31_01275 [Acidimicrobiia bacterium]|nr:hypothetical protein [Acidimicrobiia bacterium]
MSGAPVPEGRLRPKDFEAHGEARGQSPMAVRLPLVCRRALVTRCGLDGARRTRPRTGRADATTVQTLI